MSIEVMRVDIADDGERTEIRLSFPLESTTWHLVFLGQLRDHGMALAQIEVGAIVVHLKAWRHENDDWVEFQLREAGNEANWSELQEEGRWMCRSVRGAERDSERTWKLAAEASVALARFYGGVEE